MTGQFVDQASSATGIAIGLVLLLLVAVIYLQRSGSVDMKERLEELPNSDGEF